MTTADPVAAIRDLLRRRTPDAVGAALECAQRLVALEPASPRFRLALAEACRAAGQLDAAAAALEATVALGITAPEISFNLGLMLAELDRHDDAIAWYRDALRQRPHYPAALNNLGEILLGRGRLAEAEAAFVQALAVDAEYRPARFNLAQLHRDAGRFDEAARALSMLLQRDPGDRPAWVALATVQRAAGQLDAAAGSLTHAIELEPAASSGELATLGAVLDESGDTAGARDAYRRALRQDPGDVAAALGFHLTLPPVYPSAAAVVEARRRYIAGLDALAASHATAPRGLPPDVALQRAQWCNFHLAYQGEDDLAPQTRYGDWLAGYLDSIDPSLRAPLPQRVRGARIRVGFASRFFSRTTVGSYFGRWITGLDRRRFEVVVFDFAPATDDIAAAIAARADEYRALPPRERPLLALAAAIRAAAVDVLVYPELGMHDVAFTLAGMRLAPVQCCGWGHPVTTGHATIDWFLTATEMETAGAAARYRERLAGLPGLGVSYPRPSAVAPARRADFGLPGNRTLLLCPQSLFKIHPENDLLFADVLAALPDAELLLFASAQPRITAAFRQRLAAALAMRGLDADTRCRMLPVVTRETYLALASICDLQLDTLHWSGGNTSLDALACGLPLVTLPGRFKRARQSAAMLRQLDLAQLVAADHAEYRRIAVEVASNRGLRADLARTIAARSGCLFDDAAPLEAWARFLEAVATGADPDALRLP